MNKDLMLVINKELRMAKAKTIVNYLNCALSLLYANKINGEAFIDLEKELVTTIHDEGYNVKFGPFITGGNLDGMPSYYELCGIATGESFNKLFRETGLKKSIENVLAQKGYVLDVFKIVARGSEYNKGKRVAYYTRVNDDKEFNGEGTILKYYFGNKNENNINNSYKLRYKILLDDGRETDRLVDNCVLL